MVSSCLVVDDSATIRLTLKGMLERSGVPHLRIFLAETGREGVRVFQEREPDLVFLDVEMPDLPGEEACRRMLAHRPLAKVVGLTGLERSDPRVRDLLAQGCFEVLEKPLRLEKVRDLLDQVRRESPGFEGIR